MGSTAFARHYLRYRFLFLFLRLLRCFTSAGVAFITLWIQVMTIEVSLSGYPIRIPPGLSSLAALRGFSQLAASFFACWHQGIHHKPLSSFIETHGDSLLKFFRVAIFFLERISFVCLILVLCALFLGNCFSHKIVGVAIFSDCNL